jgi:hypothetical protein
MGTGLLAPFYRAGLVPAPISRLADHISRYVVAGRPAETDDTLSSTGQLAIKDRGGVISSTSHLSAEQRSLTAMSYAYRARSECALDVVSTWRGGDYFEFGSTGLATFRSFLGAFYLHHGETGFADTRFYAFDIFGDPDQGSGAPSGQRDYFAGHRVDMDQSAPRASLDPYGALKARCSIVPGYFQDTLNETLKANMRAEKRKIGFAFLDCNIGPSYQVVFDFLLDVIGPDRLFIYLDEFFIATEPPVHKLYYEFASAARQRHGLESLYVRNAAGCGALFCLVPAD